MKILFVFTGGTIGSTLHGDVISPDREKAYKIIEQYRQRYGIDFEWDVSSPYTELSENSGGGHIRALCSCISEAEGEDYDGIIVTHGTDTLAYASAAVGYSVGLCSIPVCIVSSNRPIEHERANGIDNLRAALLFIRGGYGRGAFTVYRNDGEEHVAVHRATRLLGPKAYSDEVCSVYGEVYGYFDAEFNYHKNPLYRESEDMAVLSAHTLSDRSEGILMLYSYPGMQYPQLGEEVRCVIVNTYHSGTLDTKSPEARRFYLDAMSRGVCVYASGVMGGADYESAVYFCELGIREAKNISPVALYMKIWMLLCSHATIRDNVLLSVSGDICPDRS